MRGFLSDERGVSIWAIILFGPWIVLIAMVAVDVASVLLRHYSLEAAGRRVTTMMSEGAIAGTAVLSMAEDITPPAASASDCSSQDTACISLSMPSSEAVIFFHHHADALLGATVEVRTERAYQATAVRPKTRAAET